MITIENQKQCSKCKEWKPATNEFFSNRKIGPLGLKSQCKTCRNSLHIEWQKNNPDKCSVNQRTWRNKTKPKSIKTTMITIDNQRQCSKCKEWKPATNNFFASKKKGFVQQNPNCRKCASRAKKAKCKSECIRGSIITIDNQKQCSKCNDWKPAVNEFFSNQKTSLTGLKRECKSCSKLYMVDWHFDNKDKAFANKHRRRARIANADGTATAEQIKARFQYHENRCYYCGDNESGLHVEHRIPLSRGGSNWASNLVPACPTCNFSKHTKTEKEFLQK